GCARSQSGRCPPRSRSLVRRPGRVGANALADPPSCLALRFTGFFAFAQAVHYGVWLKLLPEEDRARRGVRSFRASYRALTRDLGHVLPVAALVLTAG